MGVYDTLHYACPKCGKPGSEQTKSGAPMLRDFDITTLPVEAVAGLNPFHCGHCGAKLSVKLVARPMFMISAEADDD